jgi:putative addiction module component (TIGR02574 family)
MRAQIADELTQLSPAEKRELGEALIASAEAEASAPAISDAQRAELRARLAHHRAHPNASGVTFQELKARLLGAAG